MTRVQFDALEVGDIIRPYNDANGFIIVNKIPLIAVRTVTPSNPEEWKLIFKTTHTPPKE